MKPSELKITLKYAFKNGHSILIKGMPGSGKTAIVKQCIKKKWELLILHPVVDSPIDYKGLGAIVKGEAVFLPYGNLKKMITAKKKLIVFFDDLGQASEAVQKAVMQLLLAREINGVKISKYVTFVAATNRRSDKAGVSGILEPVKSRFHSIVELEPDADEWCKWAHENKMPKELIAYIQWRPLMVKDFIATRDLTNSSVPRTLNSVGTMLKDNVPESIRFALMEGAAGRKLALEFTGFLQIHKTLPTITQILDNPKTAKTPTEASGRFAAMGVCIENATSSNIEDLLIYLDRLGSEITTATMKLLFIKKPETTKSEAVINWMIRHNRKFQAIG